MNREAVALGVPVYTTYGGRLGGVDEALIREGRLRPLTDPERSSSSSGPPGRVAAPAYARFLSALRAGGLDEPHFSPTASTTRSDVTP